MKIKNPTTISGAKQISFLKKLFAGIFVVGVTALGMGFASQKFLASTTSTGFTAPKIFPPQVDNCNLGLIGSCNDSGTYVAGPESILNTWFFSEAIPWWLSFFLVLGAGVSVLMIMGGGIAITVGGDSEVRKEQGVKTIVFAIVGLLVILFAFGIITILENLPLPGSTAVVPQVSP